MCLVTVVSHIFLGWLLLMEFLADFIYHDEVDAPFMYLEEHIQMCEAHEQNSQEESCFNMSCNTGIYTRAIIYVLTFRVYRFGLLILEDNGVPISPYGQLLYYRSHISYF